jgi:hypothetical protein
MAASVDGRFALHATQTETINDEASITGRAIEHAVDSYLRPLAVAALPFPVPDHHVLLELAIHTVPWVEHSTPPAFPPRYDRWPLRPSIDPVPGWHPRASGRCRPTPR